VFCKSKYTRPNTRLLEVLEPSTLDSPLTITLQTHLSVRNCCHIYLSWRRVGGELELRFGHTESGLPRRATICARGGKAFELYYVRLHQPRPHRKRAAAAGQSRSRRAADICVGDRFARRAVGNCGRIHWKFNWKVRECVFLYDTSHPEYKNLVKKIWSPSVPSSHWFRAPTTISFFFYNSVLTEEVLPHRNWTSWIKEK
jgi:hypothetical protein